jgi:hypothetical protein
LLRIAAFCSGADCSWRASRFERQGRKGRKGLIPQQIRRDEDRRPQNTLALLDYLDKHVADAATKAKISAARTR